MKINKSVKRTTVKVNTAKAIAQAKAAKAAKSKVKSVKAKTASGLKLDADFSEVVRGYKAMKNAANSDYQLFGEGFANIRGCAMRITSKRSTGQDTWITKDSKGYGFVIGKADNKNNVITMGNVQVKLNGNKIVSRFNKYAQAVKHVFSKGEKNVKGCGANVRAMDSGAQYLIVSDGKRLTKVNRGSGTGRHSEFTNSDKAIKASHVKV